MSFYLYMEILVIKIQSYSDIITNSSSELFQLRTNLPLEQIKETLSTITSGYLEPILFDLKEYREFKNNHNSNHPKYDVYISIDGWFYDPKDLKDIFTIYKYYLANYYDSTRDFLQQEFIEFVNKNKYFINPKITYINPYNIKDEAFSKFINSHVMPDIYTAHKKADLYRASIEDLDGCILVLSEDDNSIPYEDMNKIEEMFNCTRYHLG